MNRAVALLLAAVLAAAAGCARYRPQSLSPAQTAARLESRSLSDPELKSFLDRNVQASLPAWPPAAWDFELLTLTAFYYQPSLEVARAQWKVAQGGIQTAGGRPNPVVGLGPGYDFDAAKGVSPWIPYVNFDLPIETAGKRSHRRAQAEQLSEAARLNIAVTAWQVRSHVRTALLELTGARQRADLLGTQLRAQERSLQLLEERWQAGAISGADLTLPRVAREKTRVDLADARRQQADALARLAEAVGVPTAALRQARLSFDLAHRPATQREWTSAEVRRQALRGRADIAAGLAEYAASESALRLEIAKQYPDVHLNPNFVWDQGERKWQFGVTSELPLLNRNQGPIAEAEARRSEAAARFLALQAKVLAEIDRALEVVQVSDQNLSAVQALREAQARQRDAVQAQFQAGAADQLDVANAQIEFTAGELARLDGQIKWQQALGALEDAVQRPLDLPRTIFEPPSQASHAP